MTKLIFAAAIACLLTACASSGGSYNNGATYSGTYPSSVGSPVLGPEGPAQ